LFACQSLENATGIEVVKLIPSAKIRLMEGVDLPD
jgi:hypothetical protein